MRAYKNFGIGLASLIAATAFSFLAIIGLQSPAANAQSHADYGNASDETRERAAAKANEYCTNPTTGLRPQDVCEKGYRAGYIPGGQNQQAFCTRFGVNAGICSTAYTRGVAAFVSDKESYPAQCQGWNDVGELRACKDGADSKKLFKARAQSCDEYSGSERRACEGGWNNTTATPTNEMKEACDKYKDNNTNLQTCYTGFASRKAGQNENQACRNDFTGESLNICLAGFKVAAASTTEDEGNACEDKGFFELTWLFCPVLSVIGDFANSVFGIIKDQLDFNINENLTPNVRQAWSVFRTIATVLLVIILLVMIISQAVGGGPFEAYTVRKILPKTVFAIILIQLSWVVFRFFIVGANAAGNGIQDLLAAPFGGQDQLELDKLLGSLGSFAPGAATLGAFIATTVVLIINPWGALMVAFIIFMAIVTALAVLLFRQALIIGCMILAPIALVLWILPGTQKYWKMWWDNFTKALLLFPLIAAMVIVGRIFAWIVGANGGETGPLDIFAVVVGFFAPFFLLPKAWGWGGSIMKMAANGANTLANKPTEVGKREIKGLGERYQGKRAKAYNPDDPTRFRAGVKRGRFGMPKPFMEGRAFRRLQSGHFIPTKRSAALATQAGDKWSSDEDAIMNTLLKRRQDKAGSTGTIGYSLDKNGKVVAEERTGTGASKSALFNAMGSADEREAGMAIERGLRSSSWVELGSQLVPVADKNLKARIQASGAEVFESDDPNDDRAFVRAYDLPRWVSKINSSEDLYPLPLGKFTVATPHITDTSVDPTTGMTGYEANWSKKVGHHVPHHIARALETMDGYIDAGNITSQSESEFREFGRLAGQDPVVAQHFEKLLHRIAAGGQGGINAITGLASNQSMTETVDKILSKSGSGQTLGNILNEAKLNAAGRTAGSAAPAGARPIPPTSGGGSQPSSSGGGGGGAHSGPEPTTGGGGSPGAGGVSQRPGPGTGSTGAGGATGFGSPGAETDWRTVGKEMARGMTPHITDAIAEGLGRQPGAGGISTPTGEIRIEHEPRVIKPERGETSTQGGVILPRGVEPPEKPHTGSNSTPPRPLNDAPENPREQ